MLNELERPTLKVSLDVEIPKLEPLKHDMDKVEIFANELSEFYNNILDNTINPDIKDIKAERTKVRKIIKTVADNRKATVNAFKEPIKDFEETSKRIEKVLTKLDDRMKDIVNRDKLEDPFADLSVNNVSHETYYKVVVPNDKIELFKKFAKENNIRINDELKD